MDAKKLLESFTKLERVSLFKELHKEFVENVLPSLTTIDEAIESGELSVRVCNCLKASRDNLNKYIELIELKDLLRVRNFGKKGIQELKEYQSKLKSKL